MLVQRRLLSKWPALFYYRVVLHLLFPEIILIIIEIYDIVKNNISSRQLGLDASSSYRFKLAQSGAVDWIDEVVRKIAAQFYFHFLDPGPIEKVRCQGPSLRRS
jgi:hypothetical protein